jgi:RNA polymerase sigma-70 factor, ECF subfamily
MSDDAGGALAFDATMPAMNAPAAPGLVAAPGSDAHDLARARAGDSEAFESLFRRHGPPVFRFAWLLTGSESHADDILQETFMRLLDGGGGFDPARGSLAAYLCGIARHLAHRAKDDHLVYVDDVATRLDVQPNARVPDLPLDLLERSRALERLYAAIRRLPPGFREVLILVELQEMSYLDAAAVAGVELGTVRSRLSRAKVQLAALLQEETQ